MKTNIVYLLLISVLGITISASIAQQNQNVPKTDTEVEKLKIQLQTVENEKIGLETKLAEANARLINADFGKFERELRDSNNKWLWGWTGFFVGVVAIIGIAFWFSVKSLIADRVERYLNGFKEAVEQVMNQQERIRLIERDYAALMLEQPSAYVGEEAIYPETVMSLSDQAIIDVILHRTYSFYVRVRAAEILKKRKSEKSLPVLLEMANSFYDTGVMMEEDTDTIYPLRDLVLLFKDIHNEHTYRGLTKLLERVLKLMENMELKWVYLNWILFSLAYVGDGVNTEKSIHIMIKAIPYLQTYVEERYDLKDLAGYFDKFNEPEGIKKMLEHYGKNMDSEVKESCLNLLEKYDPDFVKKQREEEAANNVEGENTDEPKPTE